VNAGADKTIVLAERWREYRRSGDLRARNDLVLAYAPIVKYVAGGIAARLPEHVEASELVSDGFSGLLSAVERFEPRRGVTFELYARQRISGAIYDGMRALDWVPRRVRDEARAIERTTAELSMSLRRLPRDGELARALSLTRAQLNRALQRVADSRLLALDQPWGAPATDGERPTLLATLADAGAPDPAVSAQRSDRRRSIRSAIERLTGRDQMILGLHYHQDLTLGQIGEVLGITESRVSQLQARAMIQLRTLLGPAER
jgi:RNA polymerase sigma factor for flagellar operon FliA